MPRSSALRVPTVLTAEPGRLFIDLGPVFVKTQVDCLRQTERAEPLSESELLIEADRLGADGFIIASHSLQEIYGASAYVSPFDPGYFTVLGVIPISIPRPFVCDKESEEPYYRAFRYVQGLPRKIDLGDNTLDERIRIYLDQATDLREQFARLNHLWATGKLDNGGFERLRSRLCNEASL